jgi:hypothetical protein
MSSSFVSGFLDIAMRPPVQRAPRSRVTREVYFTEIDSGSSVPRRGGDEAERYIGYESSCHTIVIADGSSYFPTSFLFSHFFVPFVFQRDTLRGGCQLGLFEYRILAH